MSKRSFLIILTASFSAMIGISVISPFLPEFAREHGANGLWLALIFAGYGLSRGMIMPFAGRLSDRFGRKIFVATGLLLYSFISLLYPLAKNPLELTIVRFLHGLSAGMVMPIVMAYVGETSEKGKEGQRTSMVNMMFYLGAASGPVMGGYINHFFGFDSIFYTIFVLGLISFVSVVLFLPDTKPQKIESENKGMPLKILIHYNFIKAILIASVVVAFITAVFISFMPSLASKINIDTHHIGIIVSLGIFIAGVLQVPLGKRTDHLDRIGKLIQVGSGVSIGLVALLIMPFCPDFFALLTAGAIIGVGAALSSTALLNMSVEIGKKAGMGTWMGLFTATLTLGMVIAPLSAGILMDYIGIDSAFYVLAIAAFFGALTSLHFLRKRFVFGQRT